MGVPGGAACSANQVWYSLSRRGVEFELLPWQRTRQMPLLAYSPLDQGALAAHAGLQRLAAGVGATPSQLALARLMAEPGVMVLPKSTDPARLRENLAAASMTLNPGSTGSFRRGSACTRSCRRSPIKEPMSACGCRARRRARSLTSSTSVRAAPSWARS